MKLFRCVVLLTVCLSLSTVQANVIWDNPAGSADLFDWAFGQNTTGFFGSPQLIGDDTLAFFPSMFRAESFNGNSAQITDAFELELTAHSGYSFGQINIASNGDYGLLGSGQVQAAGQLEIINMDTMAVLTGDFATDPVSPMTSGMGDWQGQAGISMIPQGWTHIKLTFSNTLLSQTSAGAVAFIENKVIGQTISMQPIPEPATVVMLAFGAMCLTFKKQKTA